MNKNSSERALASVQETSATQRIKNLRITYKKRREPWLAWLSGWSVGLQTREEKGYSSTSPASSPEPAVLIAKRKSPARKRFPHQERKRGVSKLLP